MDTLNIEKSIDEALKHFKSDNQCILDTVDGKQPRLRPMTMIYHEGNFYFATDLNSSKIHQLKENTHAEFLLSIKDDENNGYIRIECKAGMVKDRDFHHETL